MKSWHSKKLVSPCDVPYSPNSLLCFKFSFLNTVSSFFFYHEWFDRYMEEKLIFRHISYLRNDKNVNTYKMIIMGSIVIYLSISYSISIHINDFKGESAGHRLHLICFILPTVPRKFWWACSSATLCKVYRVAQMFSPAFTSL